MKNPKIALIIIFIITCISTNFFCFIGYSDATSKIVSLILICYLCLESVFFIFNNNIGSLAIFRNDIRLLTFIPFVSCLSCYIYHGQDILTTAIATRMNLFWLFYFVLHKYRIQPNIVIKNLIIFAFIAVSIYIIQQLFYPSFYLFDEKSDRDEVEIRNGLYRFRLFINTYFIFWALYFFTEQYFSYRKVKYFCFAFLMLVGVYLTLTRQIWFSIAIPLLFIPLLKENKLQIKMLFPLLICLIIAFVFFSNLNLFFDSDLIDMTSSQLEDEDDIRMVAMIYFGLENWADFINVLLGNGIPAIGKSAYGNQMEILRDDYGLFASDVGIVGVFSNYGLIYILVFAHLYIKIFRNFKYLSLKYRLLIIASVINLPLASWNIPIFMSMVLYLIDEDINKNKYFYSNEDTSNRC